MQLATTTTAASNGSATIAITSHARLQYADRKGRHADSADIRDDDGISHTR